MKRRTWTEEEIKILTELQRAGCTVEEICRVFPQRNEPSVRGKLRELGFKANPPRSKIDYRAYQELLLGLEEG